MLTAIFGWGVSVIGLGLLPSAFLQAAEETDRLPRLAVLYPAVEAPYRRVFADVLAGIEAGSSALTVVALALEENQDARVVTPWLRQHRPAVVITLGRAASRGYASLAASPPQVAGLLAISPETHSHLSGISLSIDPEHLFSTLKQLAPHVKQVVTVYNPGVDRWIMDLAKTAATRYNLTLTAFEASDLKTSARRFLQILTRTDAKTDALWLPLDSALMDTEDLLPVIIQESWRQRLIVFSGNLLHVDLGVLFALYPDNNVLGQALALLAQQIALDPNRNSIIKPLRAVKRAVNLRVASHLDLTIDEKTQQAFDLIFPRR